MKRLDPRLRRLLRTQHDVQVLRNDLDHAVTRTQTLSPAEDGSYAHCPVDAGAVTKRCLVLRRSAELDASLARLEWNHVVGDIYSVDVPVAELETLSRDQNVEFVEAGRSFAPMLDGSLPETRADLVHAGTGGRCPFTGRGVIVGIIDSGLDYRLDDFRNADGSTRVAFLWDQCLKVQAGEPQPKEFSYGVEYDSAAIDAALRGEAVLRHEFAPGGHGTHVAGTAVGNGRSADLDFPVGQYVGGAPDATIVFVKPESADSDATFTDSTHVADAISYVYAKADQLKLPCVINMSLGQNGGSHDAESLVERAIDELLQVPGRAFVAAAGNERTWRGHSSGVLARGESRCLRWKAGGEIPWPAFGGAPLPPGELGDFSANEMEIWSSSRDRFRVRVHAPGGDRTAWVEPGQSELGTLANGNRVFIDSERFAVLNGEARIYVEVDTGVVETVEAGEWLVEIEALEIGDGRFDAYIERDFRLHIVPLTNGQQVQNFFADQSFFVGGDFDPVQSLGTPATSRRVIAVANYDHAIQEPNASSSRGPTRDGRRKPEVCAPGTHIISSNAHAGEVLADGSVRPARIPMSGTSMAAPHVAGIVALLLQREPTLTALQLQKMLAASAKPASELSCFEVDWGFGRVDAEAAIELLD